jgi:hypothetical protein
MLPTARSKAQKRARKRGRPRLPANPGDREPNGCKTRRKNGSEARAMDVALNARIRHLGLACAEQARDPRCGYVLGRMLLRGDISEAQHGAGLRYAEDMSAWFGLCVGRFPSIRAQDLFAVHGVVSETEAQARMAICARNTMLALTGALRAAGDGSNGRHIEHAVKSVCLLNVGESLNWPDHMLIYLRKGLTSLAGHYGLA